MMEFSIKKDDAGQRLDRFLRKYLANASLGQIYKMIRKDVKVNGKRARESDILEEGAVIKIYMADDEIKALSEKRRHISAKKQFKVVYEDDDMIIVSKPFGLLTHGDGREKKNHLANQVVDYLIATGKFDPSQSSTFTPSPVNRLDRNTTGLVIFGKNAESLKRLNKMVKDRDRIEKYYMTVVAGEMKAPMELTGTIKKNEKNNMVTVGDTADEGGKSIVTIAKPIKAAEGYTLVEVELITGRTHQIRAHLAYSGYPVIGDAKYGNAGVNEIIKKKYGLGTQFLHAYRLVIDGKTITDKLPPRLDSIVKDMFGKY